MKRLDGVKRIIESFELLPYRTAKAKNIRVGPYRIEEIQERWVMRGLGRRELFNTRMGAMGYARALLMNKAYTAMEIKRMDEDAGCAKTQVDMLANAVTDSDDPVVAKKQQAERKHREHMHVLAYTVLNILD